MRAALTCLLVAGCGAATPTREPPPPEVTREPEPVAAFLVYGSNSTTIVPLGDAPIRTAPGIWIASVETPSVVVHRVVPEDDATAFGLPSCACGTIEGACLGRPLERTIHPDDGFRVEWAQTCSCWSTRDGTAWPEEPDYPVNSYGESLAPCHLEAGADPVIAVTAGSLYTSAWDSSMNAPCARDSESLNLYDLWGERHVLVDATIPPLPTAGATHGCSSAEFDPDRVIDGLRSCERDEEDEEAFEDDPCDPDQIDFTLPLLRNGRWCDVGLGVSSVGQQSLCATCVDARPDACPSALDPCGDPTPFAATQTAELYWVSTDGAHALVFGDAGVAVRSRSGASRAVEVPRDDVIGVLQHPDVGGILAAMDHDFTPPVAPAPLECAEDADCTDGRYCGEGVCLAPCFTDDACDLAGLCGAHCAEGRCGPLPDGTCSAAYPCEGEFVCHDSGRCVIEGEEDACSSDDDCGTGMCVGDPPRCQALACEEDRTPRQWAEACSRERRAEDYARAASTCRCALEVAAEPSGRGAVLYELGRVAEARGETRQARRYYVQSIAVRPNAVVQARLEALPE